MRSRFKTPRCAVALLMLTVGMAQRTNLTMSGFVSDSVSKLPLPGARIIIVGNKGADTTTDSDGKFIVNFAQGIEAGHTVRIRIEKPGYKTYDTLVPVSSEVPQRFSLERIKIPTRKAPTGVPNRELPASPNVVISAPPGNLSDRALALANKIFAQLVKFETAPAAGLSASDSLRNKTVTFRWCCLKEVRAIRDEFAAAHFVDDKLDSILSGIPMDAYAPPNEIIHRDDMEQIARRLSVLAFSNRASPRDPPKALRFSETQVPPEKAAYKFNVEVTIDTDVVLSRGFIVVEYSKPVGWIQPEVNIGTILDRNDVGNNKAFLDYLDRFPLGQTFTEEIRNAPFTPEKPIHVWAHDWSAFHVIKVTWFDD
jgi:hypothetical protein